MLVSWITAGVVWILLNLLASVSSYAYPDRHRAASGYDNRVYPPAPNTDSFWSSWAEWYSCTRTCGSGLSFRIRFCQPRNRSRADSCPGEAKVFRVCNTQSCPPDGLDFRQRQCAAYNNKYIAGEYTRRWMPAQGHHGCELKCRSADHGMVYTFGKANDSTSCHKSGKNICLNGRCLEVGCDLLLGSNRRLDVCGVCGGRNDTCALVRGRYDVGSHHGRRRFNEEKGYEEVAKIPAGSTRVHATDTSEKNFLALADSRQRFVVNGGRDISWPGSYPVAGSNLNYSRQWQGESFTIPGPTQEELYLMLLVYDKSGPPVRYEYWEPANPRGRDPTRLRPPVGPRINPSAPTQSPSRPRYPHPTSRPDLPKYPAKDERQHNRPNTNPSGRQPEPKRPDIPQEGPGRNPSNKYGDPYGHRDPRYPDRADHDGVSPPSTANDPRYYPQQEPRGREDKWDKKRHKDRRNEADRRGVSGKNTTSISTRRGRCPRCKRVNEKVRNFCESDFVIHARVLDIETVSGETRYDLGIVESFKNTMIMSHREYVWSPAPAQGPPECRCPRLRKNQDYILMGRFDRHYRQRESRLLLTAESFVRKANEKRAQDFKNLKTVSVRKCKRE